MTEEASTTDDPEVHAFLLKHLLAIQENDLDAYHATTGEDLTLYEWWVTPQRIDGLPFHDFMMESNRKRGEVFGVEKTPPPPGAGRRASTWRTCTSSATAMLPSPATPC